VATLLAEAHLVIARAGASTVAELAAVGRPSILVPLPNAIDDHQAANAAALADAGAAWVLPQPVFTPPTLTQHLEWLLAAPAALAEAAVRAAACGHAGAAARLADTIDELLAQESAA
jgi:UDP-N-acetylglucosamine--N-acetylmuramyl-(pentapeptide) pyrophosphoryl-undecaprenol N-acetylglucosamine transferase